MATAGPFIARNLEVQMSTDDITYNDVEKVEEAEAAFTTKTADASSNDSGGSEESYPTWDSGRLSVTCIADENATIQNAIWTNYGTKTRVYVRARPRGHSGGDYQYKFLAVIVSATIPLRKQDMAKYNFVFEKTGANTRNTQ